ncbi:dipeptidyl aminopeptidase/acylaminoacyl peptidase [Flavobacterium araucananum]|nr:prolyl oligopeptidase family serine peptidase [Flavobacterium araucananum]PWJ97883.1 dipeptidyl aminopeptidase/acylaminoacyl peptidase [Flavobacterium araucananum]
MKILYYLGIMRGLYFQMLLIVTGCCIIQQPVLAQDKTLKKRYTRELDSLWSKNVYINALSNDGQWIAFEEAYHNKQSTLYLRNTRGTTSLKFATSGIFNFSNNNKWFAYTTPDNKLKVIDLSNLHEEVYNDIQSFSFSYTGNFIAANAVKPDISASLLVIDLVHNNSRSFSNAGDCVWHPNADLLAAQFMSEKSGESVLIDAVKLQYHVIYKYQNSVCFDLKWTGSGNALTFLETAGHQHKIHFYDVVKKEHKMLDNDVLNKHFLNAVISNRGLSISDDGNNVFFYRKSSREVPDIEAMEAWDTDEPWIYPQMKDYKKNELPFLLTAWDVRSDRILEIADKETPSALFNPNHPYSLVFNKLVYEPQYRQFLEADIYSINNKSGKKQLVIKKQSIQPELIALSPKGNYVAYFNDSNWWIFNVKTRESENVTSKLKEAFRDVKGSWTNENIPFGSPGWSEDENLILYDQYDIWLMDPTGMKYQKITSGRAKKIKFRINRDSRRNDAKYLSHFSKNTGISFDLDKGILLDMTGEDFSSGFAFFKKKTGVKELCFAPIKVDEPLISLNKNILAFKTYRYNLPPSIHVLELNNKLSKILYQSNTALLDYDLGQDQVVHYPGQDGDMQKGVLIYPANFQAGRKYPMIVYIYEQTAEFVNSYNSPTQYSYTGFNILNFVTKDYFVLLPDIIYRQQNPGYSALQSVRAAVSEVLKNKSVDKNRIGLIGHSFGGYETAYIATQSNIFAAAVAGAPVTDLVSWYHDVAWDWKRDQMWRIESQQYRMGASFYDLKEQYNKNSPLYNVQQLNTPLLLWAGKEDYNVNWSQSIYMHMAMKRLHKKGKLLLFKNEGHNIMNLDNQELLSKEIEEWFDTFCKKGME